MNKQQPRQVTPRDAEIGFRIRKIRQDKRLSQGEVATSLGITYQQLQKYELGKNKISASRLSQIAEILGVPDHKLLVGEKAIPDAYTKRGQDEKAGQLWQKLKDDQQRHIVLMLMESLSGTSN